MEGALEEREEGGHGGCGLARKEGCCGGGALGCRKGLGLVAWQGSVDRGSWIVEQFSPELPGVFYSHDKL